MATLIRWIRKLPLWAWLFLALTQFGGIFTRYSDWQTTKKILADWREHPSVIIRDSIERMERLERADYRDIWVTLVLLIVFLACAAVKRREKRS